MPTPRHLQPDPATRDFGTGAVAQLSGVNRQTLTYWDRTGFLSPGVQAAGGGRRRRYSFQDVLAARVAQRLRSAGVSLQALRRVVVFVQGLEGTLSHPLAERYLVMNGSDVEMVAQGRALSVLGRPGQVTLALGFDLETERANLREEVYRLAA